MVELKSGVNMLPPGIAYHRGLLFDEANLEAVVRYTIANRPYCNRLSPQQMSDRVWEGLARLSNGFDPGELGTLSEHLECVHGVYFTLSWNMLEGLSKEGVWCRGHLVTFLARLGRAPLRAVEDGLA